MQWLRLWTHSRLLPHQCQTHVKCILPSTYDVDVHMDVSLQCYPCSHGHAFGRKLKFWWSPKGQTTAWWVGWGYEPIQDDSHMNAKHMLSVSSPSNAEGVHVDISLQRYCFSLLPYFWKMIARTRILVITQTQGAKNHNSAMVEAMDPIPDYSHINVKHMLSVFQHLHMLWMCIWMYPC